MPNHDFFDNSYETRLKRKISNLKWNAVHLDPLLLIALISLASLGMLILYSASNESFDIIQKQMLHLLLAFGMMFIFAQIHPNRYEQWAPWVYTVAVILLAVVLVIGKVDQGGKRWLALGFFNLQPSEIMKLAMPMMLARFLSDKTLPPNPRLIAISFLMLIVPILLTAKEPDLGTAIIIACSGFMVLMLAGMSSRLIIALIISAIASAPVLWHFMHTYQKQRVLTFLNPEHDPLGTGYHIIQSKIAIGSGGMLGKGWLNGTQSHLSFLPAHTTDFIFAVSSEELGFLGCLFILLVLLAVFARSLYISTQAQNTFCRLLAGSLSLTFIISSFVNIGMVTGILPVVGIPLPLVSYGGSSMVTMMIGFGMIMSMHTHRKLWSS